MIETSRDLTCTAGAPNTVTVYPAGGDEGVNSMVPELTKVTPSKDASVNILLSVYAPENTYCATMVTCRGEGNASDGPAPTDEAALSAINEYILWPRLNHGDVEFATHVEHDRSNRRRRTSTRTDRNGRS